MQVEEITAADEQQTEAAKQPTEYGLIKAAAILLFANCLVGTYFLFSPDWLGHMTPPPADPNADLAKISPFTETIDTTRYVVHPPDKVRPVIEPVEPVDASVQMPTDDWDQAPQNAWSENTSDSMVNTSADNAPALVTPAAYTVQPTSAEPHNIQGSNQATGDSHLSATLTPRPN